jgi:hypothetical protein
MQKWIWRESREAFPVQSGGLSTDNGRPVYKISCICRHKKQTNLITHSGNNGTVPVGRKACDGLQGEGASWSYECDDVGFEMHVRRQTWGDVSGARRVTARTCTNTRESWAMTHFFYINGIVNKLLYIVNRILCAFSGYIAYKRSIVWFKYLSHFFNYQNIEAAINKILANTFKVFK